MVKNLCEPRARYQCLCWRSPVRTRGPQQLKHSWEQSDPLSREGVCYYQEDGGPIQKIPAGGFINVKPGVKHWHGASPDGIMIHTAIGLNAEKGLVNWMEPVSDEQYNF